MEMKTAIKTLVKDGAINIQNSIDKGCNFKSYRYGGVYLNGEMVLHSDISDIAKVLEMEPPKLYERLTEAIKIEQLNLQKSLTASEIFSKVENQLKAAEVFCKEGVPIANGIYLSDTVIKAFDELGIFISVNYRRILILPRLDEKATLTRPDLDSAFQRFIEAIDPHYETYKDMPYTTINGCNLVDSVIRRLTTH